VVGKNAACTNLRQNIHLMRQYFTLCLLFIAFSLQAQVFMRPVDNAAAMGMGGATVALPGFSTALANEAQLGLGEKLGFFASSAIPFAISGWNVASFQGVVGIDKTSGVGLGIWHSGIDGYQEQRLQLAYGRRLADKFYLGVSADVLHNDAQEYGANTAATFSLSILAHALPQVWLGAKIQNPLQQKIGVDVVPTVLRVGAIWKPTEKFFIAMETEKDLERPTQVKAGVEYHPVPMLAVRAGTRAGKVGRMTFGLGLRLKNGISLDVGSEWHPTLGITPSAMIAWRK